MQSRLDILAFASRIMLVGYIFSQKLYLSISGLKSPFSHIRLSNSLKEDLVVWAKIWGIYNGQCFFQMDFIFAPDFYLFTESVGSRVFGAIWRMHWCCGAWLNSWISKQATKNVVMLELFLVLVAVELRGVYFENRYILVVTDTRCVLFHSELSFVQFGIYN